jgi:hypothetical protein
MSTCTTQDPVYRPLILAPTDWMLMVKRKLYREVATTKPRKME